MDESPTGSRLGSPSSRVRNNLHESVSASKLYRDLSPTRVYATAGRDAAPVELPELFKQRNGLQSLRPAYAQELAASHEDDGNRTPKLLQRLESLLDEKLALVERLGSGSKGFAAAQLRTDAYRQVFDAFLHSFTTYRSLLMRIKSEYDVALDDALASLYDNVHMRAEIAVTKERMETAMEESREAALQDAAAVRKEITEQLRVCENQAMEAEHHCSAAELEMQHCRARSAALRKQVAELQANNRALKHKILAESSWGSSTALVKAPSPTILAARSITTKMLHAPGSRIRGIKATRNALSTLPDMINRKHAVQA